MKNFLKDIKKNYVKYIAVLVLATVLALLLGFLAKILDEINPVFGNVPSWVTIVVSCITILFSSDNINKSNQNSIKLASNNRSVDFYIEELRKLIDTEKLIVGSEIKAAKDLDTNNINFEMLWDLVIDNNLSFSNNRNEFSQYNSLFRDVTYSIYRMPSAKKEMFNPLMEAANNLLPEFHRINSDYKNNGVTDLNIILLKGVIINLTEIHDKILKRATSELDKYYKIDDRYI
ncbi:hypothetical protein [Leuconostoc citreum]|uniref:hypothetical protein n=1 Tax=Leuconostoc citreum TaxID=33964 RepID=UPI003C4CA892